MLHLIERFKIQNVLLWVEKISMLVTAYITLGWPLPERRGKYFETGKIQNVGSESERGHPRVLIQLLATFVTFTFVDLESRFKICLKRIWNLTISGLSTYFFMLLHCDRIKCMDFICFFLLLLIIFCVV